MSKSEKTRQWIVEKTAPVFNTKGYAGTSLTDMTEVTGLTKGSIYGNFQNKDEVALAAFDHNFKQVQQIIRQEMDKYTSCKNKLMVYAEIYENFLQYPFPKGGCPVQNTAIEADDTHPELRKRAANAIHYWKNTIIRLVEKGIEKKEFKPSADPENTALTMIAMIEGGIMISHLTGRQEYRVTVMQSLRKLIKNLSY